VSAQSLSVLAASVAAAAALTSAVCVVLLGRRLRALRQVVLELRTEALPLVHQARVVVDQAASEMERVGDVLGSAEAVSATVDSASRLAYRAFANPVVRVLAFGSGLGGALRRLLGRSPRQPAPARRSAPPSTRRMRRARRHGHAEEVA
jgi:hypothetical protein